MTIETMTIETMTVKTMRVTIKAGCSFFFHRLQMSNQVRSSGLPKLLHILSLSLSLSLLLFLLLSLLLFLLLFLLLSLSLSFHSSIESEHCSSLTPHSLPSPAHFSIRNKCQFICNFFFHFFYCTTWS